MELSRGEGRIYALCPCNIGKKRIIRSSQGPGMPVPSSSIFIAISMKWIIAKNSLNFTEKGCTCGGREGNHQEGNLCKRTCFPS